MYTCYDCNKNFINNDKLLKHRDTRGCRKRREKNGTNVFDKIESFSFNYIPFEEREKGYIYCFSNPSIPNILKIGMTTRTPEDRLKEANSGTWVALPFKIEFYKEVQNPLQKEKDIHNFLKNKRVNDNREFFNISIENAKNIFELI